MPVIYLVRHGHPAWPEGKCCFSRTDAPLSAVGKEQVKALGEWFAQRKIAAAWTSSALRCRETAALILPQPPQPLTELEEISVGEWEGLHFDQIKAQYPQLYEARGKDPVGVAPPGGETFLAAGERLWRVIEQRRSSTGDSLFICHGGLIRGLLCFLGLVKGDQLLDCVIPYGSVTILRRQGSQTEALSIGTKPCRFPGPLEEKLFFAQCQTPPEVLRHSEKVEICAVYLARGTEADVPFLSSCARLHDLCRHQGRQHPEQAAQLLEKRGWKDLAQVIRQHHDLGPSPCVEAEILCLADRMVVGDRIVSLRERFAASRRKCQDSEGIAAWERRWNETLALGKKYGVDPDRVYPC